MPLKLTPDGLARLKLDEGFRAAPYDDETGQAITCSGNITIGYGTNLSDGLSTAEADWLLQSRLMDSQEKLERNFAAFQGWQDIYTDVLLMIDYNCKGGVLEWRKLIMLIATDAPVIRIANEVRDSDAWRSSKTHARYERMACAIEAGHWP